MLNPPSLLPPMTLSFCTYQPRLGLSGLKLVIGRVSTLDSEALRGEHINNRRIISRKELAKIERCVLIIAMMFKTAMFSHWIRNNFDKVNLEKELAT